VVRSSAPRTLLGAIIARNPLQSLEEVCEEFEQAGRNIGEKVSLSPRQLDRWIAGMLTTLPRPAACRVAEHYWQRPIQELLGLPSSEDLTPPIAAVSTGEPTAGEEIQHTPQRDPSQWERELVMAAAHESMGHATDSGSDVIPEASIEQLHADVVRAAREYRDTPPLMMLAETRRLRNTAWMLLDRTRRPAQKADLYLASGQLCALMSVASFDLAVWDAAEEQARAAYTYAEIVDHPGLRAWTRGMQSLVAYWSGRPREAARIAAAGADAAPAGKARVRLLCISARAWSHLGDADRTKAALDAATREFEDTGDDGTDELHDEIGGEFGWGHARMAMCSGTALLRIGDAASAAAQAALAMQLHDEDGSGALVAAKARADLAQAELMRGQLDAATAALDPLWTLPSEHRRHGLVGRLTDVGRVLTSNDYRTAGEAASLRDRIEVFTAESAPRALPGRA